METRKIGLIGGLAIIVIVVGVISFVSLRTEEEILTVEYDGMKETFTLSGLMEMKETSILTDDPHLKKEIRYDGVSLETIADELEIGCSNVTIIAKDGYNTTIDSEHFTLGIVVTYRADGETISEGEGGPIKLSLSREAQEIYDETTWVWWITELEFS
jgi:hypothetical protein